MSLLRSQLPHLWGAATQQSQHNVTDTIVEIIGNAVDAPTVKVLACINMDQSWVRPLYNSRPDRCNGGLATSPGRSKPGRDDVRSKL